MNAKGKVICTDLDGTLFFPKRKLRMLTNANKNFLRSFIDGGGRLVIVSGRNKYFGEKVIKRLKRKADIVGCNSAFVICDGKQISETPMDNIKLKETLDDIKKRFKVTGSLFMTRDYNMIVPKKQFWWFHRFGHFIYHIIEGTYRELTYNSDKLIKSELDHGCIYKVMLFFGISKKSKLESLKACKEMQKLYKDFEFSWCGELIEVNKKGCTKAQGIKQYLDYLKIKHDNVMVVGDSGNDISMFRDFKNSFCMSHAPLHVSKYANHVIESVSELEKYIVDNKEEKIYE